MTWVKKEINDFAVLIKSVPLLHNLKKLKQIKITNSNLGGGGYDLLFELEFLHLCS